MYRPKIGKDIRCPLEYGLSVFGGKWRSRIICVLTDGALRYSALRREMTDISDPVLAAALKELMDEGMVERRQFEEIPPRVEYSLSEKGRSAVPILKSICRWSGAYYREDNANEPAKCRRCDYSGGAMKDGSVRK